MHNSVWIHEKVGVKKNEQVATVVYKVSSLIPIYVGLTSRWCGCGSALGRKEEPFQPGPLSINLYIYSFLYLFDFKSRQIYRFHNVQKEI